jgi:hypothetical protein
MPADISLAGSIPQLDAMSRVHSSDLLLTRHPHPRKTESLARYLIRISAANGFDSAKRVLSRAGLSLQINNSLDVAKLATIIGWEPELRRIGYRFPDAQTPYVRLLGHYVSPRDLWFTSDRVCTECIRETGFVEAHYDLALMVACPVHNRLLVDSCPSCQDQLALFRPGLLVCDCGASIDGLKGERVESGTSDLLDIVRRKTLKMPFEVKYSSRLPVDCLTAMPLRSLLATIRALGRHSQAGPHEDCAQYVQNAADALSNWPKRFRQILRTLEPDASTEHPLLLTKSRLSRLHQALSLAGARFVIDVISEYAVEQFGPGSYTPRGSTNKKRANGTYLTQSQFAKENGVIESAVQQLVEIYQISTKHIKYGMRKRIFIDTSKPLVPRKIPGLIYSALDAATMIGVPMPVLLRLRVIGVYTHEHMPAVLKEFHDQDIRHFTQRLAAFALPEVPCSTKRIRFDQIMASSQIPVEAKVNLIKKALTREISLLGSQDGTVNGLLFPQSVVEAERSC